MQIFRGCYPFTDARTEVFQVPLTWFTLMYFCIYTALLYPIRDASGAGIHVLLRAKSRALWWFSKCLALTVWNLLYFAVGFCSVCVFCFFTNGLSCFTILPYDVLPCDALTCLLPFGFALAISLLAFCLCIFCSFVWGQVFAICLAALCAPLSIFFQRPERQHDMDMRVAGSLVMSLKCLRVLKLMVCPKYSRFFKMFTMVDDPHP